MTTEKWNYRIIADRDPLLTDGLYFAIHTAYYKDGQEQPYAIGENPATIVDARFKGVIETLTMMREAATKPVLCGYNLGPNREFLSIYDP
jgi:hypothetical protein